MEKDYNVENLEINISNHCLQRYIERVKNGKNSIVGNDAENGIKNEIKKLFISSELYFDGVIGKSPNPVKVYCNRNGWILLLSRDGKTLITLYKVDLGVDDDELNQAYVDKALEKISTLKNLSDELEKNAEIERTDCNNETRAIEAQITELENEIKLLRRRKEAISSLSLTASSKASTTKVELRNALEDFIIKDKLRITDNN